MHLIQDVAGELGIAPDGLMVYHDQMAKLRLLFAGYPYESIGKNHPRIRNQSYACRGRQNHGFYWLGTGYVAAGQESGFGTA